MTHLGHVDAFPRPGLSARCRFSQGTFAGPRGNGRDAPIPDLPALTPERGGSTRSGHPPVLLDHLVGAGEQEGRDRQAERFGGVEIDHQPDLCLLLDRQIGWLRALQDPPDIGAL